MRGRSRRVEKEDLRNSIAKSQTANPQTIRDRLKNRVKNGPAFTDDELAYVKKLSDDGSRWLEKVGIGKYADAENFLLEGDYKQWLQKPDGTRLLIAKLAESRLDEALKNKLPDQVLNAPSLTLALHLALRGRLEKPRREELEELRNSRIRKAFVDTLVAKRAGKVKDQKMRERDRRSREVLIKVFLMLKHGLQVYDADRKEHMDFKEADVARALAHGGRVNIRIPQLTAGQTGRELMEWLGFTKNRSPEQKREERRSFATHHMVIGENKVENGEIVEFGKFEEIGGRRASALNLWSSIRTRWRSPRLYGLNLSAGGLGGFDFNGDTIMPDGGHGHLFLGFTPPTSSRDGALQVGVETTAPGKKSPVGYKHGPTSTQKTANPESSFYGHKADYIGSGELADNQRLVDLNKFDKTDGSWIRTLEKYYENFEKDRDKAGTAGLPALYEKLVGKRE